MAPRKRARAANGTFKSGGGGSQTGGTGDVKPQILTRTTPSVVADDFSVVDIDVPRIILTGRNDATIMEILKVWFYLGVRDFADTTSTKAGYLSTIPLRTTNEAATLGAILGDISHPGTFASVVRQRVVTVEGGTITNNPTLIDLTDNNGNGVLIATDRFFFTSADVSGTTTEEAVVKILYRMVSVGIVEYVGIVQSQSIG